MLRTTLLFIGHSSLTMMVSQFQLSAVSGLGIHLFLLAISLIDYQSFHCDLLRNRSMTDVIYSLCAGQTIRLTLPLVTPNILSDTNISITGSVKGEWRW